MQYFSEEHSADVVKQQYENCENLRLKKIMESAYGKMACLCINYAWHLVINQH